MTCFRAVTRWVTASLSHLSTFGVHLSTAHVNPGRLLAKYTYYRSS